jgi:tRNA(Ile)-lysidine synthetase-like protein
MEECIAWWFSRPDIWFGKRSGTDIDIEVCDRFESVDTESEYANDRTRLVFGILKGDQYIRHSARLNRTTKKNVETETLRALEKSRSLVYSGVFSVEELAFALINMRHCAKIKQDISGYLEILEVVKRTYANSSLPSLIKRGVRSTYISMSDLAVSLTLRDGSHYECENLVSSYLDPSISPMLELGTFPPLHAFHPMCYYVERWMNDNEVNMKDIVISLSGGLDSMVLLTMVKIIFPHKNIHAIHVNYGNRGEESDAEESIARSWANRLNVNFSVSRLDKLGITKSMFNSHGFGREMYEEVSRTYRFAAYRHLSCGKEVPHIFLGHHLDDIDENLLANLCAHGRKASDASGMSGMLSTSVSMGTRVFRPFVDLFRKKDLIDFAKVYQIPFSKDSTSEDCSRGILRNRVIKPMNEFNPNLMKNIHSHFTRDLKAMQSFIMKGTVDQMMESMAVEPDKVSLRVVTHDVSIVRLFWNTLLSRLSLQVGMNLKMRRRSTEAFLERYLILKESGKEFTINFYTSIVVGKSLLVFTRKKN